ncbi:YihA family ribosome biogenesis GTP-binding protein [Candidatus Campbellbacteria bacterium]|nr:MAG: YihA family ribosome biogenesis GTP-binding protein [Candidatus Campbellbacteria bacterium]
MEIKKAEFIKGIKGTDDILESDILNIAFYGRSNVGKSSCINAILGRKNLVKSSSKPGKTKEINFFNLNDQMYFVDLPGYGYAKMSQKEREKLRKNILWYIMYSEVKNRINIIVLDAKVGLSDFDKQILHQLLEQKEKVILLFNKIDKLNQKTLSANIKKLKEEISDQIEIVKMSALKQKGTKDFWKILEKN